MFAPSALFCGYNLLMHGFVRNLITEWRRLKLPVVGESVIVGVSGGADSVSLLLAVDELTKRGKLDHTIIAAHLNHKLRGDESDADENFVKELCGRLNVGLVLHSEKIKSSGNLEQNARDARYRFLAGASRDLRAFAVLTAHTMNDQAEGFLLNLIRGSGPDGLSGMKTVRTLNMECRMRNTELRPSQNDETLLLVRPLLTWAQRSATENYCHERGIEYRYDTMNDDTAFKRVRIRKVLLPLLEDMNPRIVETLANTASLMQTSSIITEKRTLDEIADELKLSEIRQLAQDELYAAIRGWLRHHRGSTRQIALKHIQAIERLVSSSKSGRVVELPGGTAIKSAGKLVYKENKVDN